MNTKSYIFKNSSTTYYYSSLFFPKKTWEEVADLYAFVRIADNFVDELPQDSKGLDKYINDFELAQNGKEIRSIYSNYILNFAKLSKDRKFDKEWINAFFYSMKSDIVKNKEWIIYKKNKELEKYIYGSAETIGLMMAKILELDKKSYKYAQMLGSAMQHINFIRDIKEDCALKRQYLPQENFKKFNLQNLCQLSLKSEVNKQNFINFIHNEISIYNVKQKFAEEGYKFIPYRYLLPIKTASDLYKWTAKIIYNNPNIVFVKKVKPSKFMVLITLIKNIFLCIKY